MFYSYQDVNFAFKGIVSLIAGNVLQTERNTSRAGDVLSVVHPVMVTYEKPKRCVLFNRSRDCNPFFHMFEALWMLAGRNDVKPLQYYSANIGKIASDDGITFNGAYGFRWRGEVDQLTQLIEHLQKCPDSRRAVLQMWNIEDDLLKIDKTKDVCCNLCVCFMLRHGELDMTVFNRSNDLVWGMMGANVVQFSFLQRYIAGCLGVEVGKYRQVTNNLHVYLNNWKPEEWLIDKTENTYETVLNEDILKKRAFLPLVCDKQRFDREVKRFIDDPEAIFTEPYLQYVAAPMMLAFRHHKERDYGKALEAIHRVKSLDWMTAGLAWITDRKSRYERGTSNYQE